MRRLDTSLEHADGLVSLKGPRHMALELFRSKQAQLSSLSGPNRAMQPRRAIRFKSHTPKLLAMRNIFFFR